MLIDDPPPLVAQLLDALQRRVPGLHEHLALDLDVSSSGPLGHTQRALLVDSLLQMAPTLERRAVRTCRTLGEAAELAARHMHSERRAEPSDRGSDVTLRVLRPQDYWALYESSLDPTSSFRWRFRGATPSPEAFESGLFADVLTQYAVVSADDSRLFGLVSAYAHRPDLGSCYFAFQRCRVPAAGGQEMITGAVLFIDHLFRTFPLRRVYAELPEYNYYLVDGILDEVCHIEATLQEQYWHDGRYWSSHTLVFARDQWSRFMDALRGPDTE